MRRICFVLLAFIMLAPNLAAAAPGDWTTYNAPEYGFSMLIPEGTPMKYREAEGGWGVLSGAYEGVTFLGVSQLGPPAAAADIVNFGVKLTGIPEDAWSEIDKGSGNGWTWYRTVRATRGDKVVYGGYGVGKKGSYLLLLVTTPADFAAHRAEYDKWYNSIRLS